jgi:uncharacterized protein YjbI with pentapeptide repeats
MPRRVISQPLPIDIRNWSFRGQNCEGWNFEGRDIRGCDFSHAKLHNANFKRAVGGRSQKQIYGNIFRAFLYTVTFLGAGFFLLILADSKGFLGPFIGVGVIALLKARRETFSRADFETIVSASAFTGSFTGVFAGCFVLSIHKAYNQGLTTEVTMFILAGMVFALSAAHSLDKTVQELKNSLGTNFQDANLKGATFSHATLNNCNFDNAETTYVNWSHVEGARSSIDFTNIRMQLLISRKGNSSMYSNLDLSDRYLTGIELIKANLSGADLTRSNLQKVDLTLANLTNAKAGDTDFRHATLTGACIQNWTINSGTQFDALVCEHIFLTPDRDPQNRRPLSGSFEPGDFELLVDKFADTLDFILRRGTDPATFKQALNQFERDNPTARMEGVVNLDANRALVQTTLPKGTDKVKPYEAFLEDAKRLEAAQHNGYLEGRVEELTKNQGMMERLFHSSQRPIIQVNNPTGDLMPDNRANNINTAIGKSAISTGSGAAAAGNITNSLNNGLAALSETADPKDKELVDLINQVKEAIEAPDSELEDSHKKRALKYLDNITQLAKDKPENLLEAAEENIDHLANIADKGSKLASFAAKYAPILTAGIAGLRLWFGI